MLVISNRTRAAHSFDFEIPRMISDQIALHSVQLASTKETLPNRRCANTVHHAQRARSLAREIEKMGCMSVPYCNVTIALTVHHVQRVSYPVPTSVHVPKREKSRKKIVYPIGLIY